MPRIAWPASASSLVTWAVFGFLAGVLAHALRPLETAPIWVAGAAMVAGAVFIVLRKPWTRALGVLLVALALGFLRFDLTLPRPEDGVAGRTGAIVTLVGRVTDVRLYDAVLAVETIDGRRASTRSRVAFSPGRSRAVGDRVSFVCRVKTREAGRVAVRDARQGVFVRCRGASQVTRLSGPAPLDITALLARWRAVMSRRIRSILPGDEGALLAGILYGERGLSSEAAASFRNAGMTHIIAVSGSNVALVTGLIVPIWLLLGYRRKTAIVLSGLGLFVFVLFVGAQASVVRAALMGWLALLARVFGRKASAPRLLTLAAAVIVLFDPWALAFDAGFALSFLATWGLIAWSRPIARRLPWIPETFGLREIAATTLSATLITAPYTLWAFERAALSGLVTNLFALPLLGLTMLWGALAVMLAPLVPALALPAQGCLRLFLAIAALTDRVPWLNVSFQLPTWGLFAVYGAIFVFSWRNQALKAVYPQIHDLTDGKNASEKAAVRKI